MVLFEQFQDAENECDDIKDQNTAFTCILRKHGTMNGREKAWYHE